MQRFKGGAALARELGLHSSYVNRKFAEGMTEERLRAQVAKNSAVRKTKKKSVARTLANKKGKSLITSEQAGGYAPVRGKTKLALPTDGTVVMPPDLSPRRTVAAPVPPETDEYEIDPSDEEAVADANYYKARARNEQAKARERELIVAQRESAMVYRSQVDIWVRGMILKARNMLTRIGPDLQDRLAMETVPAKCGKLVSDEIQQALEALVEYEG